MSDLYKIILTSVFTILGGVFIFSFSKLIEGLYLAPIIELDKIKGRVAHCLVFNANKFGYVDLIGKDEMNKVSNELRSLASDLTMQIALVRRYKLMRFLNLVLPRNNIAKASMNLIGLSNTIYHKDFQMIEEYVREIKTNLNLHPKHLIR